MTTPGIYEISIAHFLRPIAKALADPDISEVMINGPDDVRVETQGRIEQTSLSFENEAALEAAARNIIEFNGGGRSKGELVIDGHLPDGTRVNIVFPPAVRGGIHMTFRKFREASFDLPTLIRTGSLTKSAAEFLAICVRMKRNIIVSGGTGTGKTSFLNALAGCISSGERVVTIEDTPELQFGTNSHTVSLLACRSDNHGLLSIRELFANALRMRPDRIIVGEVRRGEALDLIQSMLSGHGGALGTVHGGNALDALIRLETLCLMNDLEMPVHVARQQVGAAVDVVVQLVRDANGLRRVECVTENTGIGSDGNYRLNEVYRTTFNEDGPTLECEGSTTSFAGMPRRYGLDRTLKRTRELFAC